MRAQTILFLLVDRVRGKLDCRPYRPGGEGNPKRLVEAVSPRLFKPVEFLDDTRLPEDGLDASPNPRYCLGFFSEHYVSPRF